MHQVFVDSFWMVTAWMMWSSSGHNKNSHQYHLQWQDNQQPAPHHHHHCWCQLIDCCCLSLHSVPGFDGGRDAGGKLVLWILPTTATIKGCDVVFIPIDWYQSIIRGLSIERISSPKMRFTARGWFQRSVLPSLLILFNYPTSTCHSNRQL